MAGSVVELRVISKKKVKERARGIKEGNRQRRETDVNKVEIKSQS